MFMELIPTYILLWNWRQVSCPVSGLLVLIPSKSGKIGSDCFSSQQNGGKSVKIATKNVQQKCINQDNPEFSMSNCWNKASSYRNKQNYEYKRHPLVWLQLNYNSLRQNFQTIIQILCTSHILSQEIGGKSKKIGSDQSPWSLAFRRYVSTVLYFLILECCLFLLGRCCPVVHHFLMSRMWLFKSSGWLNVVSWSLVPSPCPWVPFYSIGCFFIFGDGKCPSSYSIILLPYHLLNPPPWTHIPALEIPSSWW